MEETTKELIDDTLGDYPLDNNDNLDNLNYDFVDGDGSAPMDKYNDLIKELTNFDPLIQARIKNWLGIEWDDNTKEWVHKYNAIINERGARWAIGFLRTYQARPNILTNIDEREFKNLQKDIIKVVWLVFPTSDEFGVEASADWYRLCTELEHSAFLVLAGAGDGKYTKFLGDSVQRTEHINLSDPRPQHYAPVSTTGGKNSNWLDGFKKKLLGR